MIIKDALTYSGTNFVAQVALFIQNFVLRRILPPEVMGVWNMVLVVRGYVQPVSLGALSGAARELPILKGRGDLAEEVRCRSVAFTYSLVEILAIGLCVWAYAFWRGGQLSRTEIYALLVAGGTMVLLRLQEAYTTFLQGGLLYTSLSNALLVSALISAVALPIGAIIAGMPGLLVAAVISELLRSRWMVSFGRRENLGVSFLWEGRVWKRLVSYGLLYSITTYPHTFFAALDLFWITRQLSLGALGVYALAKTFCLAAADITTRMGNVLYTRTLAQYGQGVTREKIATDMRRVMQFQLLVSVPVVCWGVAAVAPFLIREVIPLYAEGIPVMLVLLLGSFFMSQNSNLIAIWIAEKRLIAYGLSNLFGVFSIGGCLAISWFGLSNRGLTDIAVVMVLGYAGYFAYMAFTAGRELWGFMEALVVFLQVNVAAAWLAVVFTLFASADLQTIGWQADLVQSFLSAMRMLIALLPLIAFGLWVSGGGKYLYRTLGEPMKLRLQGG